MDLDYHTSIHNKKNAILFVHACRPLEANDRCDGYGGAEHLISAMAQSNKRADEIQKRFMQIAAQYGDVNVNRINFKSSIRLYPVPY